MNKTSERKKFKLKRPERISSEKQKKTILSAFFFLFFLFVLIWGIRTIRTYQVDGLSMNPTFEDGDRLFIAKEKQLVRYELITFFPDEQKKTSYVKRIVGLPGDKIRTEGNALYINEQLAENSALTEGLEAKKLPDGTLKVTITKEVWDALSDLEEIPADSYFVLGDNRSNSTDSRHLGLIKKDQIDGVVIFRYYPFDSIGLVK
ncbi:signal peptidase I [Enterococcus sp. BWR-S5]|uniref:signal peptidase I n=1 Tax=Enterococcus sp. BWR-S5 TaxID=2787714 RepID=UPI00192376B0|nr:signal peptidase I [Enterococcus sp. BWR-S5]MBL1224889.1 signal peptidase I [Enterococcus sp. BWR-S5]